MKIRGPQDASPAAPAPPVGEAGAPDATAPVAGVEPAAGPGPPEAIRAIAEDLRAGRITAREAVERLVDRAVSRLGPAASPETAERARAALLDLASRDPYLAGKIRQIAER